MKRVGVLGAAVIAVVIVVVAVVCRDAERSESRGGEAVGGAAARATGRGAKPRPDPRTLARVALSGVVTSKGGEPIAGASVCVQGEIAHVPEEETRDPKCAATDATGRYRFDGLYAGAYAVSASAARHVPVEWRGPPPENDYRLELTAGQQRHDVDFTLGPGGVEVSGTVSDVGGGPIAGAWVYVNNRSSILSVTAIAQSGADGKFVTWTAPGAVTGTAAAEGYTSEPAYAAAPTRLLDIQMTPACVIAGTVVDAITGAPVAGAAVDVRASYGSTTTDEQGRFRLTRLTPGRYTPIARSPGKYGITPTSVAVAIGQTVDGVVIPLHAALVGITGRVVIEHDGGRLEGCKRGSVLAMRLSGSFGESVGTSDDGTAVLTLLPGRYRVSVGCAGYPGIPDDQLLVGDRDIGDQLWKVRVGATIAGTATTRDGAPVPRAQVYTDASPAWGTTDEAGTFRLVGVAPGTHKIHVVARGLLAEEAPTVTVAAGQEVRTEVVLHAGGTIAGVVVDERGRPVRAVHINAYPTEYPARSPHDWFDVVTDDAGRFEVVGVATGDYNVWAGRSRTEELRKAGSTDDNRYGERVHVTAGQTTTVRLVVESAAGTIAGVVVDGAGAPVTDATVRAMRESDSTQVEERETRYETRHRPVVTDASGAFRIEGLVRGRYTVYAERPGTGQASVEHVAVGTTSARLVVRPLSVVSGTATQGNRVLDEFAVTVRGPEGFAQSQSFFRTKGQFVIEDLPAGSLTLDVSSATGHGEVAVALAEGEHKRGLVVRLETRVRVRGRLVALDDGSPVPELRIEAKASAGYEHPSATSGADGGFVLEDVATGRIAFFVQPLDSGSPYAYVYFERTIGGAPEVDLGPIKVARRRRDANGDLGFHIQDGTVALVRPGGPAARAGLAIGDTIRSIDGTDVSGDDSYLLGTLLVVPAGTTVTLVLARGVTIKITAEKREP